MVSAGNPTWHDDENAAVSGSDYSSDSEPNQSLNDPKFDRHEVHVASDVWGTW